MTFVNEQCHASRAATRLYTHRNTLLRQLSRADEAGELGELIVIEVVDGLDRDLDLLVARADIAVEAEEAVQVQVAVDRDLQAVETCQPPSDRVRMRTASVMRVNT